MSGGLDSTVTFAVLRERGFDVVPFYVDYGQTARLTERRAFEAVCNRYGSSGQVATISMWDHAKASGLLGAGDGASFYLSHRNLVLMIAADTLAARLDAGYLAAGLCQSSPAYPDCNRQFCLLAQQLLQISAASSRVLITPLIDLSKSEVVALARTLDVPIGLTVSCYLGSNCSLCEGCRDRIAALATEDLDASRT